LNLNSKEKRSQRKERHKKRKRKRNRERKSQREGERQREDKSKETDLRIHIKFQLRATAIKMMRITIFIFFLSSFTLGLRPSRQMSYSDRRVSTGLGSGLGVGLRMTDVNVDVAVIGGGIAGSSISWLLQERENCTVTLIDPKVDTAGAWYPNYGEWRSEWHHLSERLQLPELKECTTTEWEITDCFFGGSFDMPKDERTTLPKPYVRVDRIKMQVRVKVRG
jgi:hypothetical protein